MNKFFEKLKLNGMILALLFIGLYGKSIDIYADTIEVNTPQNVKAVKSTKTSIKLSWKGEQKGDQYQVYRYNSKRKSYKKIGTVKNDTQTKVTWIDKKLKTNKTYKYKVVACRKLDGKIYMSKFSYWVSAKTYTKNAKKVNAGIPKINKKTVYLNQCSTKKVRSTVKASKYGKNKHKIPISKKVRWYSSNTSIATVDKRGNIVAGKTIGKCYIYAKAHNGVTSKVSVVVKNYARPAEYYNLPEESDVCVLLTDYKNEIQRIAEYCQQKRITGRDIVTISLEKDSSISVVGKNFNIEPIKKEVEKLLISFPYYVDIKIESDCVTFITTMSEDEDELPATVQYFFDYTCDDMYDTQVASHWIAYRFRPI